MALDRKRSSDPDWTDRAMVRAMCGVKLMNRKKPEELINMLGLNETLDKLAKANEVQWYGYVLRTENDDILRDSLQYQVNKKRGW